MFNFAWSEIALVAVVALVLIGPKDLPVAIRAIAGVIKKLRAMAGEFQGHVDEMMREADLASVRDVIDDVRSFDIKRQVAKTLDPDRVFANAMTDPFGQQGAADVRPARPNVPMGAAPIMAAKYIAPSASVAAPPGVEAPAFIPPGAMAPAQIQPHEVTPVPPAFIPPTHADEF